ncbi:hypothetical protein [Aeromonas phage 4L372D]|uniref:Uncharacterized protein n=2 Tax=Plateaulakevirus TaxID=2843436 RepID=A0A5B9N575_9CAUD|nr:hypothetical protein HWC25_gp158 [Aeromonas phage 2L372D]YP_009846723.1 hypothetical protein HWC27_gp216 [Aeromonas phage 4L372D]QDB74072.1 hypothetical protein 2L372D_158 [Aeromonas phage 2L372D]QEG08639.1 hypothetical protein [Aeromonas phage 4L372D]
MDLGTIYNLLQKAQTFDEFMTYNNVIVQIEEENLLTNYRNGSKIDEVKSGKNKILGFINRNTKEDK